MIVTPSSIRAYNACRRRYYYRYVEGLVPRVTPKPLLLGKAVHRAIAEVWKGKSRAVALRVIRSEYDQELLRVQSQNESDKLQDQLQIALALVALIPDPPPVQKGEELLIERPIRIRLGEDIMLDGRLDSAVVGRKLIDLYEFKTASQITPDYVDRLVLDLQVSIYLLALCRELDKKPGALYYIVFRKPSLRRKQTEQPRAFRQRLKDTILKERSHYLQTFPLERNMAALEEHEKDATECALQIRYSMQRGHWSRCTDQCFHYGRCTYAELCLSGASRGALAAFERQKDTHPELTEER